MDAKYPPSLAPPPLKLQATDLAFWHLTGHFGGAIMLTASHMPFNSNGLKFFTAEGGLEKTDISEILQLATQVGPEQRHFTMCDQCVRAIQRLSSGPFS